MAYTWTTGETITAEKLNNTGGGVLIVNSNYNESTETAILDKTWQEIYDAVKQKTQVIIEETGIDEADSVQISLYPVTSINRNPSGYSVTTMTYNVMENVYMQIKYSSTTADGYPSQN